MGFLMKIFGTKTTVRFEAIDEVTGKGFTGKLSFESMGMTWEEIKPKIINGLWVDKGVKVKPGSFKVLGVMTD
jgi:hypothetical protein